MARRPPPNRRDTAAWTNALRREAFATIANGPDRGRRKLELIARAVVRAAMEGDLHAAKEIGDRLEGRPLQRIEADGMDSTLGFAAILALVNEERRRRVTELTAPAVELAADIAYLPQVDGLEDGLNRRSAEKTII
jgi:hypothetical protein